MVKVQKLVPQVYYTSRDFQVLARSLELIANYCKTNIDLIRNVPISKSTDNKLTELLANHLGFNNKFTYSSDELSYILQIFRSLIKSKGTLNAIETLVKNIFLSKGLDEGFTVLENVYSHWSAIKKVSIILSKSIGEVEVLLLQEVLDYIFPISCIFNIQNAKVSNAEGETIYTWNDYVNVGILKDSNNYVTNIKYASTNTNLIVTSQNQETGNKHGKVINPIVGNIKLTRVVKKKVIGE